MLGKGQRNIAAPAQKPPAAATSASKVASTLDTLKRMAAILEQIEALQKEFDGLKGMV